MKANSGPSVSSHESARKKRPPVACGSHLNSVVEALCCHLMAEARRREIRQAVAGARFCAVMLDDGGVGVANLCPDVCGRPSRRVSDRLPRAGTPAADALVELRSEQHSAIGLATANALANRPAPEPHQTDRSGSRRAAWWDAVNTEGDLLDGLELRPEDEVGMVGCFSPLVEPIRQRTRRLFIFERTQRLNPDLLPASQAAELLPRCSVALITATTLINGTIDALLAAAVNCREVILLGPSTPLVPGLFVELPCRVTVLAGMVASNAQELLRVVARDGGTRDFGTSVAKVTVRTTAGRAGPLSV